MWRMQFLVRPVEELRWFRKRRRMQRPLWLFRFLEMGWRAYMMLA